MDRLFINENVDSLIHSSYIGECIRANSECDRVSRSFSKGGTKTNIPLKIKAINVFLYPLFEWIDYSLMKM